MCVLCNCVCVKLIRALLAAHGASVSVCERNVFVKLISIQIKDTHTCEIQGHAHISWHELEHA